MTTDNDKGYKAGSAAEETPVAIHRAAADDTENGMVKERAPKRGAPREPPRNGHKLQHALDSRPEVQAHRLILGTLPASLAKVERQARDFRSALELAVVDAHGGISLAQACLIATAARWERHGLLALRWLRERATVMDDTTRLSYSREIAKASSERDKAIAALKIESTNLDPWVEFDADLARQNAIEAATRDGDGKGDTPAALPVNRASGASVGVHASDGGCGRNLMDLPAPGLA